MDKTGVNIMKLYDEERIKPYFQPIVCVSTSKILGYEVLGRIETKGVVKSLGPFFHDPEISDDEKVRVDRIIRHKALEIFKKAGEKCLLFLNIQPRWLLSYYDDCSLPTLNFLNEFNIDGSRIVIEICESSFNEETRILADMVGRYRKAGCKIALDDFGQGFTDLDRIISLRPDYLKMRMGFTREGENSSLSRYLLESLGSLCQKIGLNLVLEEIETVDQLQIGLGAGARYFQGYYFSPASADMIEWERLHILIEEGLTRCMEVVQVKQSRRIKTANELNSFVAAVFKTLTSETLYSDLTGLIRSMIASAAPNWVRVYCCQSNGYQTTPNYFREVPGSWLIQPEYLGRNWSWRPYFFPNVSEARQVGKGVLSDTYLDMETGLKIWTFTFPLVDDCFLFIDSFPTQI